MINLLLKSRAITLVIAIFLFLNSIAFLIMGVLRALKGYKEIAQFFSGVHSIRPGIHIAESLDSFLISIVIYIMAAGVIKVFYLSDVEENKFPSWLNIRTFKDLKIILWEAILMTLVVVFVSVIATVTEPDEMSWTILILPISILLLAVSLIVMKGGFQIKK